MCSSDGGWRKLRCKYGWDAIGVVAIWVTSRPACSFADRVSSLVAIYYLRFNLLLVGEAVL
jgi:hypothetical protein